MNPDEQQPQQPQQQEPTLQQLGIEEQPNQGPQLDAFNSEQDPQTITAQQLQQVTNPQLSTLPLQQEMQQWSQNQNLPTYDKTIQSILNVIDNLCNVGGAQTLKTDVQAKSIQELSAAAHYLAQAAQQEGEHIPAAINVRLQGAQLDMQMHQQAQQMALQHQQQNFQQQQAQQQQQHEQALALAKQHHDLALQQAEQAHRHQLEREKHQADLHTMAHGLVMNENQQAHDQQLAEQQHELQSAQAEHQAGLAEQNQQHQQKLAEKQVSQKPKAGEKK